MRSMRCPDCATLLYRGLTAKGYIWICRSCGGTHAPVPVLRRLLGNQPVQRMLGTARPEPTNPKACAICSRRMQRAYFNTIELDACRRCNIIWFDHLELESAGADPFSSMELRPALYVREDDSHVLRAMQQRMQSYRRRITELEAEARERDNAIEMYTPETWQQIPYMLGFPVRLQEHRLHRVPVFTYMYMAFIAVFGILSLLAPEANRTFLAFVRGNGFNLLNAFTYPLVAAGWLSLLLNQYFLYLFAPHVEDTLGKRKFSLLLLIATLVAAIGFYFSHFNGSMEQLVGSGPVTTAVLVFYTLTYPHARLRFSLPLIRVFTTITAPAWFFLFLWVGVVGFGMFGVWWGLPLFNISALLGGMLAGALVYFWRQISG